LLHYVIMLMKVTCCCGHATFFVSCTQRNKAKYGCETDNVCFLRSLIWAMWYLLDVLLGTPQILYVALMQRRHKTYASIRRASVLDGVCTMSDSSVASAKPRWSQKQWKPVIRAVRKLVLEHSIIANLHKNTLVHKIRR